MSVTIRERVDAKAVAILVGLCALWGLQQVAVKLAAADGMPPVLQAGLRSLGAASCLIAFTATREGIGAARALFRADAALRPGALIGVVFAVEFFLLYPGLRLTTAAHGILFLYTAPFFTALGAHLFLPAERLGARQVLGLTIAFTGVGAAFAEGFSAPGASPLGDLMCLAGGVLWGVTTIIIKASAALRRSSPARIALYQLGGSAPLLLAAAALRGEWTGLATAGTVAWVSLAYQTVVVGFASYLVWFWLVQIYPAGRLSGFTFATPLFGVLFGHLFLGEQATPALFLGVVAIGIGLRLLNGPSR